MNTMGAAASGGWRCGVLRGRINVHNILCIFCPIMDFEYDPVKSETNVRKHGGDFDDAQKLWQDSGLLALPFTFADENRFLAIGRIENIHWTAIFTERGEIIRIISVRRSRAEEKALYERNQ